MEPDHRRSRFGWPFARMRFPVELEARFSERSIDRAATDLTYFLPAAIVACLCYAAWTARPANAPWVYLLAVVFSAYCGFLWFSLRTRWFREHHEAAISSVFVVAGATFVAVVAVEPLSFESASVGMLLLMMALGGTFRISLLPLAASLAAVFLLSHLLPYAAGVGADERARHALPMLAAGGFASFVGWLNRSQHRRTFLLEVELLSEKERGDRQRENRIGWLQTMARFLRHELKNQLIGVRTSLDLAEKKTVTDASHPYLNRARRSVAVMERLVHAATEATSIQAALREEDPEILDLTTLVQQRVAEFEAMHGERSFALEFVKDLHVVGSEPRLIQLLDKLLGNACDHSPEGSGVEVALESPDGHASLRVRNRGSLQVKPEEAIQPFVSASTNGDDNLGIGLFVASEIAKAHAGSLAIAETNGCVEAVVVLPLAAEAA